MNIKSLLFALLILTTIESACAQNPTSNRASNYFIDEDEIPTEPIILIDDDKSRFDALIGTSDPVVLVDEDDLDLDLSSKPAVTMVSDDDPYNGAKLIREYTDTGYVTKACLDGDCIDLSTTTYTQSFNEASTKLSESIASLALKNDALFAKFATENPQCLGEYSGWETLNNCQKETLRSLQKHYENREIPSTSYAYWISKGYEAMTAACYVTLAYFIYDDIKHSKFYKDTKEDLLLFSVLALAATS